jgi:hypothetical protein
MSNVVEFKPKAEPHSHGEAFCFACDHTWQCVAPVGVTEFECPNCRAMKGRYKFAHYPSEGQLVRECNCGNQLFYLTPEGHMCANCGIYQQY